MKNPEEAFQTHILYPWLVVDIRGIKKTNETRGVLSKNSIAIEHKARKTNQIRINRGQKPIQNPLKVKTDLDGAFRINNRLDREMKDAS